MTITLSETWLQIAYIVNKVIGIILLYRAFGNLFTLFLLHHIALLVLLSSKFDAIFLENNIVWQITIHLRLWHIIWYVEIYLHCTAVGWKQHVQIGTLRKVRVQ